jgi:hypothetical protein
MRFKRLISVIFIFLLSTTSFAVSQKASHSPVTGKYENVDDTHYFPHRSVITTPYFDTNVSIYGAGDLLILTNSINQDLLLLQQSQSLENLLNAKSVPLAARRPTVALSGKVESQIVAGNGFDGATSDINLTSVALDIHAIVSRWASAFMSLSYDDGAPVTGNRESNSRLYLQNGFFTLGSLNSFPFYLTFGQLYVPFGAYSASMVTTALTQSLARIQARTALLGFLKDNLSAQVYAFNGSTHVNGDDHTIDTYGANLSITGGGQSIIKFLSKYTFGAGVVSNIANSQGMQDNGLGGTTVTDPFSGFSENGSQALQTRVPAFDVNANIMAGSFIFIAEYIGSLKHFSSTDLTYNRSPAKPRAVHVEINYLQHIRNKLFTFGVSCGRTWDAVALNLPQYSYAVFAWTSPIKNTITGIEFRHDTNYDQGDTGSGNGGGLITATGKSRNLVTAQIGVYF